ncbi:MAG TPA: TAXI family TRAP transporter solute-binding subunit [Burkholderiales bacterium]|nr:TAXI family TRAP transporter solute-binding subunit [Burkholderiales bacterium]
MKKIICAVLVLLAFCFSAQAQQKETRLAIGTGGTGGVWYPLGGAMANIFSKTLPNMQATAEVTGGSVDNIKLIATGQSQVGFSMADAAWDADQGKGKFKEKVTLRTLAVFYPQKNHVVTLEGNGINKMSDLKGRRVSVGSPGSGSEIIALRVLEAYGINPDKDIIKERLSVAEAVNALKDRKIDAFIHNAAVPIPAVVDLGATPGIKIKLIDHGDAVAMMNKKYGPLYSKGTLPAKTYPGQDKDATTVDVWAMLLASDKMSDQMAYNLVKTLFEKKPDLMVVAKDTSYMTFENQFGGASPIPFHPGALKFFAEKGFRPK